MEQVNKSKRMSANEIRAALLMRGIKLVDIAREFGVTVTAVSASISERNVSKSWRIRELVARKLGMTQREVFGEEIQPVLRIGRASGQ